MFGRKNKKQETKKYVNDQYLLAINTLSHNIRSMNGDISALQLMAIHLYMQRKIGCWTLSATAYPFFILFFVHHPPPPSIQSKFYAYITYRLETEPTSLQQRTRCHLRLMWFAAAMNTATTTKTSTPQNLDELTRKTTRIRMQKRGIDQHTLGCI